MGGPPFRVQAPHCARRESLLCYSLTGGNHKTGGLTSFRGSDRDMTEGATRAGTTSMNSSRPEREAIHWQEQVESVCARQGLHLTPLRQRVLTILSESSAPLGAYAI